MNSKVLAAIKTQIILLLVAVFVSSIVLPFSVILTEVSFSIVLTAILLTLVIDSFIFIRGVLDYDKLNK